MGPRNPSPDPLSESESEEEENANYLNESSGEEWDSSEEEDPVVSNLTPLESLARQVKCLLKYSTTWKSLNPNSWLYHAKLLDASTPVHILREIGLRLSHCSHCVPKLEPIPEWPPLASCGVPPFQKPLMSPSRLSRDRSEERFKSPPILPPHLLQVILNKDTNISVSILRVLLGHLGVTRPFELQCSNPRGWDYYKGVLSINHIRISSFTSSFFQG